MAREYLFNQSICFMKIAIESFVDDIPAIIYFISMEMIFSIDPFIAEQPYQSCLLTFHKMLFHMKGLSFGTLKICRSAQNFYWNDGFFNPTWKKKHTQPTTHTFHIENRFINADDVIIIPVHIFFFFKYRAVYSGTTTEKKT